MASEFFSDEHTELLQRLVQEIVNDPSTYKGSALIPSVAVPARKIRVEVVEATGGLTQEHAIGTDPKTIQSFGTRVEEFEPPAYKEKILWNEKDILFLRELGQNDRSKRGIRMYIDKAIDRLNRRLEARIEKLRWDAIFQGSFQYFGKTFSYGIPAANQSVPAGALWSLDSINANAAADPVRDIRYWIMGGYAPFRKYNVTKGYMNPNTARWILDNANTRSYLTSMYANPVFGEYDLNKVMQFLIPGCPVLEVNKTWYQEESVDGTGKISVASASYFLPDGYIHWECELPGGDKLGEFVQGAHLSSGSIDQPGFGKFLVIDENIAPGTKGGPSNPFIDIIAGVYGGVNLYRPFDVLTSKVIA